MLNLFCGGSKLTENATAVISDTPVKKTSTMLWLSAIAVFALAANIPNVLATISVISDLSNETVKTMTDQPARFIPEEDAFYDIQGYVVYAEPATACTPVKPPPASIFPYPVHWILVARRYDCDFQTKIENAQNASYYAIIVHNVGLNTTEAMGVSDASKLNIFAVFVGEYDGLLLRDNFTYEKQYSIRIQDDFSFNGYIIPFAIVIGVCFIVLLLFMVWQQVMRWIRERRRNRKRRLPASALKKLPTQKWTKGDPYETCAICIEDFVVHDKIRVLPCSHGFHTDCIDPWLTKGRRVCPICKRKVVLAEERFSDSDSDSGSETAPLLGASTSTAQPPNQMGGSTFVQQRENPFRRAQRRHRTRPPQRTVTIHDTESSSENDDDDYVSSSDPSESNESDSHKSVFAEVHSSQNNPPIPRPCVESSSRVGDRSASSAPAHFAIQSTSHVTTAAAAEVGNDSSCVIIPDLEEPEFASEVHPSQNPRSSDGQSVTETGTGASRNKAGHSRLPRDVDDPIIVNVTTSCNSQDFSNIPPDLSSSSSSSSSTVNQALGNPNAPKSNPFKSNNAIV